MLIKILLTILISIHLFLLMCGMILLARTGIRDILLGARGLIIAVIIITGAAVLSAYLKGKEDR